MLCVPVAGSSCGVDNPLLLPADERTVDGDSADLVLVARFVQITDSHIVDTTSPARFAGAHDLVPTAWRPWESYSTQILDGIVRAANRIHASGTPVDFLIHTGDFVDNAQSNELEWFVAVMDGRELTPLSGPDDRPIESRPPPLLDPYATFQPQGLYRTGAHGDLPSIPWYGLTGNHHRFATGVFPILTSLSGQRMSPLPLRHHLGILLPSFLNPTGILAHGNVTPADPGPPRLFEPPRFVVPVLERRYFTSPEFLRAMFDTITGPAGHGFPDAERGPGWYSIAVVPGLRLIALDTSDQVRIIPTLPYSEGCISQAQMDFLRSALDASLERGEQVIVATHHPSRSLAILYGAALGPESFRDLLNRYPSMVLHIAGHTHVNRVAERGGYVEIETCSTIDPPQEGRVIEIWRDVTDDSLVIGYHMFSHLDDTLPPLGDDPLRALRLQARQLAEGNKTRAYRQKPFADPESDPRGAPSDREGQIRLKR